MNEHLPLFRVNIGPGKYDFDWSLWVGIVGHDDECIARGTAFTYQACTHQAGNAIMSYQSGIRHPSMDGTLVS